MHHREGIAAVLLLSEATRRQYNSSKHHDPPATPSGSYVLESVSVAV